MGLKRAIDITTDQRETIVSLLSHHLPNAEVWVYGSRVKGTSRPESDLDMVVFTTPEQAHAVSDLREAFEESDLPFRVDLFVWDDLPKSFREAIKREHAVLVETPVESKFGWPLLTLGEACTKIGSGATPRGGKEAYVPHGPYALIRSQNVFNDGFRAEGLARIDERQAAKLDNVEVANEDVLLNITGDSVARACQVRPDILPSRVNQHVAIIRPDPTKLDPLFLRYALVAPDMQAKLLSWAGSGGTRNALTKGMIELLEVAAPPSVYLQRATARVLGALDDKIDLNRRMNETLEAMARAIFKDWFVDFGPTRAKAEGRAPYLAPELWELFPDALDGEGKPVGWAVGSLSGIAESPRRSVSPGDVAESTPYIGLEHMPRRAIALGEWEGAGKVKSGKTRFKRGDFLFGKLRPYFHKVGVAALDGICSTDIVVVGPRTKVWGAFVLSCLSSDEFVDYTDRTSTGTKMPRTKWKAMGQYRLCLPPEEVVCAFQDIAQSFLDRLNENVHQIVTLTQVRDLLLPKLTSGELRIVSPEAVLEPLT